MVENIKFSRKLPMKVLRIFKCVAILQISCFWINIDPPHLLWKPGESRVPSDSICYKTAKLGNFKFSNLDSLFWWKIQKSSGTLSFCANFRIEFLQSYLHLVIRRRRPDSALSPDHPQVNSPLNYNLRSSPISDYSGADPFKNPRFFTTPHFKKM